MNRSYYSRYQAELTVSLDKTVCKLHSFSRFHLQSKKLLLLYSSNLNRKNPSFLLIYNLLQHLTINNKPWCQERWFYWGVQTLHMATNHNVFSIIIYVLVAAVLFIDTWKVTTLILKFIKFIPLWDEVG